VVVFGRRRRAGPHGHDHLFTANAEDPGLQFGHYLYRWTRTRAAARRLRAGGRAYFCYGGNGGVPAGGGERRVADSLAYVTGDFAPHRDAAGSTARRRVGTRFTLGF
jgi:hypothetical protein